MLFPQSTSQEMVSCDDINIKDTQTHASGVLIWGVTLSYVCFSPGHPFYLHELLEDSSLHLPEVVKPPRVSEAIAMPYFYLVCHVMFVCLKMKSAILETNSQTNTPLPSVLLQKPAPPPPNSWTRALITPDSIQKTSILKVACLSSCGQTWRSMNSDFLQIGIMM